MAATRWPGVRRAVFPTRGRRRAACHTAQLIRGSAAMGYVECRGHLTFMDPIADQFDVNDHAGRRLNKRIKDALDPNGILSPGRQGSWPTVFRREAEARRAVGAADHPQVPASVL